MEYATHLHYRRLPYNGNYANRAYPRNHAVLNPRSHWLAETLGCSCINVGSLQHENVVFCGIGESTDMATRTLTVSHPELDRYGVITRVRERRLEIQLANGERRSKSCPSRPFPRASSMQ
jgi:hypothetical protein